MLPKYVWAVASIAVMWLAVLFVGVFGADFRVEGVGGDSTEIPVVWGVVPFAMVATIVVVIRGFRE
jgi:hypothetical protein